jgi:hypothetical protein
MQLGFVDATQGPFSSDSDFNARNREVRFIPEAPKVAQRVICIRLCG